MEFLLGLLKDVFGILNRIVNRQVDDLIVYNTSWSEKSGTKKRLKAKGYRIVWAGRNRIYDLLQEGYEYVTVPHRKWWRRRIRVPDRPYDLYLMKVKEDAEQSVIVTDFGL